MLIKTRRDFLKAGLKSVSALGAMSAFAKFGEMNALAATGGYQALVCIFMSGGNDGHNTVIPIQTAQQNYSQYSSTRLGMALPQNSLLPVTTKSGDTYGLHPSLPEIQALYNQGKCGIVSNVGMLVAPTSRTQYLNNQVPVPANLFSHSDQTTQWQNVTKSGISSTGWGGRLVDQLQLQGENSGARFPAITTTGGCGLFCTGANNLPTTVPYTGAITLSGLSSDPARNSGEQLMLAFDNGMKLVQAGNSSVSLGNGYAALLNSLISGVSIPVTFPANNTLASQLQMVAQIIAVHSQLGLTRQIFFCQLDLFDTHSDQIATQASLLQEVSQAVAAFYQATVALGVDQNVVTFTCSEFGRTLMPNSSAGTDHAWGGHHFAIGSGVLGGDMYGAYPLLAFNTGSDATGRGAMIPGYSVDQYGSTLAKWFGVDITNASTIGTIFPNLANFTVKNIGFLG